MLIFWFDTSMVAIIVARIVLFLQYHVVRAIWNDHLFIKLMMRCLTCRLLTIYFLFIGFTDWCWMKIFTVASGSKKKFLKLKKNVLQFAILSPFAEFCPKIVSSFRYKAWLKRTVFFFGRALAILNFAPRTLFANFSRWIDDDDTLF